MSNQLKSDHYLYFLKDKNNVIRYVGIGRLLRYKRTQGRSEKFMSILNDGGYFTFPHVNLTKAEAILIESNYLENIGIVDINWNLTNKVKSKKNNTQDVKYDFLSKYVYLDNTSLTGLRWVANAEDLGLPRTCVTIRMNAQAGWPCSNSNYGGIQILKKTIPLHRALWSMYNSSDLPWYLVVNHINSDTLDNSKKNLEAVTFSTNSRKKKKQHNNSTGVCGVSYISTRDVYVAHIYIGDTRKDKTFSVNKYGNDLSLEMATTWRKEMEILHYTDKFIEHDFILKDLNE